MKNLKVSVFMLLICFLIAPLQSKAATTPSISSDVTAESARSTVLLNRLEEINKMDKNNISNSEKRALRKEVRTIKKEMNDIGGGVYLSVGAVIIIVLLLIILL
jgi:hypothetical protein